MNLEKQVEGWKKEHNLSEVFVLEFEDEKVVYFKKPSFLDIRVSLKIAKEKTFQDYKESVILGSILGGDFDKKSILLEENEAYFNEMFDSCFSNFKILDNDIEYNLDESSAKILIDGKSFDVSIPTRMQSRKAENEAKGGKLLEKEEHLLRIVQKANYSSLKKTNALVYVSLLNALTKLEVKKKSKLSTL